MTKLAHTAISTAYNIASLTYGFKPGQKPAIFLFSSRRGGSTLMAELIACDKAIRYIDQPFDLFKRPDLKGEARRVIKQQQLPDKHESQFINLTENEDAMVKSYIQSLINGAHPIMVRRNYFGKNRVLLKIVNALPLINQLTDTDDIISLYLVRHPIAQSLSVIRNKWGLSTDAYLSNQEFTDSTLNKDQLSTCKEIASAGTDLEQATLNWALENLVPLKHSQRPNLIITYEELVLNPSATINLLIDKLSLNDGERMREKINSPSASSAFSSDSANSMIRNSKLITHVSSWKETATTSEKKNIQEMLNVLNIDEYNTDNPFPNKRMLQFPNDCDWLNQQEQS